MRSFLQFVEGSAKSVTVIKCVSSSTVTNLLLFSKICLGMTTGDKNSSSSQLCTENMPLTTTS